VTASATPRPIADSASKRPTSLDPRQLGFTPRPAVPWLNPILLAGTAVRVVLAQLFGAYLDKRELQGTLPGGLYDESHSRADEPSGSAHKLSGSAGEPSAQPSGSAEELWLDYVADLGDGFDATYSVAYLLAQPALTPAGHDGPLPRAQVVVMGGDQVYPTADGQQYEDRFKGPYRAALPEPPPDGPQPTLYALPGNHDWYDGLTAFLRLFARTDAGHIGGWRTRQQRSYFVLKLPQRWWLFAIDIQFGAYLDEPQLRYFRQIAAMVQPGDKVILCPPTPTWVESTHSVTAYETIDFFVRKLLAPTGADVRVMIAGDLHHYARYTGPGRELITCGGGGAYLYPTHRLPKRLEVPRPDGLVRGASPTRQYDRTATYPPRPASRRLALGVFGRLPLRNIGFVTTLGLIHVFLMLAYANAMQRIGSGVTQSLVTIPLGVMIVLVLGSTVAFSMPSGGGPGAWRHWAFGFGHGLAHLALGFAGARLWLTLPLFDLTFPLPLLAALVMYLPPVALAASLVLGAHLLLASRFDVNVNELFAGQGITDWKCFLRMHIAGDGSLTIYPIAIRRTASRWTVNVDGAPHEPWIEPTKPLHCELAEPPVRID
jgi:hypothetical protein